MSNSVVLTSAEQPSWQELDGGLKYRFVASGGKFRTGIAVMQPGMGEVWHRHADDVEETYYVLRGRGRISWKSDGMVSTIEFGSGDALYLPCGLENELKNIGSDELWIVFNITNAEKMRD
jgi:mannose-6-phosphate isomerase-like protein (cupin superfamily)